MNINSIIEKVRKVRPEIWENTQFIQSDERDIVDFLKGTTPPEIVAQYMYGVLEETIKNEESEVIIAPGKAYSILLGLVRRESKNGGSFPPFILLDNVKKEEVEGKKVLIFDDSICTGKTISDTAEYLLKRNAKSISGVAIIGTLAPTHLKKELFKNVDTWQKVPPDKYEYVHYQTILNLYEYLEQPPMNYDQKYLRLNTEEDVVAVILALDDFTDSNYNLVTKHKRSSNIIGHVDFIELGEHIIKRMIPTMSFTFQLQQLKIRFYFYLHENHCNFLLIPVVHQDNFKINGCINTACNCPKKVNSNYSCGVCADKLMESVFLTTVFSELCICSANHGLKGLVNRLL
jgi:hypothetical protein